MAKKKTKKSKKVEKVDSKQEQDKDFELMCKSFRSAKIDFKKAKSKENETKSILVEYVEEHDLEKGNYFGVKVGFSHKFLESNVELAKKKKIDVPMVRTVRLMLSDERIKALIKRGIIKKDEIKITNVPDLSELKKIFKKEKVSGIEYEKSTRLGISEQ